MKIRFWSGLQLTDINRFYYKCSKIFRILCLCIWILLVSDVVLSFTRTPGASDALENVFAQTLTNLDKNEKLKIFLIFGTNDFLNILHPDRRAQKSFSHASRIQKVMLSWKHLFNKCMYCIDIYIIISKWWWFTESFWLWFDHDSLL